MSVTLRRLVVALAGGLLASGGWALAAAPAASAPSAGACTDTAGVTVVVDFGTLGGGVQVRCAPAPVKSGFDALTRAGFSITSVSGQAFLCRIDGQPAEESCSHIPSAARYWSYWHASRGEDWTYSASGASRTPPPGSVEGWSFGARDEPGAAPPGPITTTTTTRPVTPPSTSPPTSSAPVVTTPGSPPTSGASETTTPSTTGSTATTAATRDEVVAPDLTPTGTTDEADPGSPVGLLVAGTLLGGLGVAGFRTARRRSRDAEASG